MNRPLLAAVIEPDAGSRRCYCVGGRAKRPLGPRYHQGQGNFQRVGGGAGIHPGKRRANQPETPAGQIRHGQPCAAYALLGRPQTRLQTRRALTLAAGAAALLAAGLALRAAGVFELVAAAAAPLVTAASAAGAAVTRTSPPRTRRRKTGSQAR